MLVVEDFKEKLKNGLVVEDEEAGDNSVSRNQEFLSGLAKEFLAINMKLDQWEESYQDIFVETLYLTLSL